MDIKFRLTPGLFRDMQDSLVHYSAVEQGCFLLFSVANANDSLILLGHELIHLNDEEFTVQRYDQLSVSPSAMLRVARTAQANDAGVCFIHTHPMSSGDVDFSLADDYGNARTFGFFNRMLPERAHVALVFSCDMRAVSGRLYHSGNSWEKIGSVTVAGHPWLLTTTTEAEFRGVANDYI